MIKTIIGIFSSLLETPYLLSSIAFAGSLLLFRQIDQTLKKRGKMLSMLSSIFILGCFALSLFVIVIKKAIIEQVPLYHLVNILNPVLNAMMIYRDIILATLVSVGLLSISMRNKKWSAVSRAGAVIPSAILSIIFAYEMLVVQPQDAIISYYFFTAGMPLGFLVSRAKKSREVIHVFHNPKYNSRSRIRVISSRLLTNQRGGILRIAHKPIFNRKKNRATLRVKPLEKQGIEKQLQCENFFPSPSESGIFYGTMIDGTRGVLVRNGEEYSIYLHEPPIYGEHKDCIQFAFKEEDGSCWYNVHFQNGVFRDPIPLLRSVNKYLHKAKRRKRKNNGRKHS